MASTMSYIAPLYKNRFQEYYRILQVFYSGRIVHLCKILRRQVHTDQMTRTPTLHVLIVGVNTIVLLSVLTQLAPESAALGKFLSNVIMDGIEQKWFIPAVFHRWVFLRRNKYLAT